MTVGTIVRLRVLCLGNPIGTLGIGINDYGDGCQFIFANGEYDGFSSNQQDGIYYPQSGTSEQEKFLEEIGFDEKLSRYKFRNTMQLSRDFDDHLFDEALNPVIKPYDEI